MTMPIQLTICRFRELWKLLKDSKYDAIISITDPYKEQPAQTIVTRNRREFLLKYCPNVLCLDFEDNDFVSAAVVNEIIAFAKTLPPNARLLAHCMVGRCRSTAAALIVLRECGLDYGAAYTEVMRVRPIARPNIKMLCLYGEIVARRMGTFEEDLVSE